MAVITNESIFATLDKEAKTYSCGVKYNGCQFGTRAGSSCTYVRLNTKAQTWNGVSTGVDYREIRIRPVEV